jgi:hypothetical protein
MKWFKHITSSYNDPTIREAELIYKDAAYVIFFKALEVYGEEYCNTDSDGFLTINFQLFCQKLHKSSTKVEQLFNFFQEKEKIFYSVHFGLLRFKVPKFNSLASNWTKRKSALPTEVPTEVPTEAPTAIEVEVEIKKEKNIKKRYNPGDDCSFFKDPEFKDAWKSYQVTRHKKKCSDSERAIKAVVKKLIKLSGNDKGKAIRILDQSANSGWSDLYELKTNGKENNQNQQTIDYSCISTLDNK